MNGYPTLSRLSLTAEPALSGLLEQLQQRHRGAICCTLVYGSCLRSGDIHEGLLDLYLICDGYQAAYGRSLLAMGNWLLPPNVFYSEFTCGDRTVRSKVAVISLHDFRRGSSEAAFESYIWGRFAQPTQILSCRDEQIRQEVQDCLLQAARTLLRKSIPALPSAGPVNCLWTSALALSYSTELRTERSGRAAQLTDHGRDFYATLTRIHADSLGYSFELDDDAGQLQYRTRVSALQRGAARVSWFLRRVMGKIRSVMRLLKALFTFEGGLDYIAWKLERHSGEPVSIPDKVRRAPLIHLWGFFWGLYRRGIFK